MTNSRKALLKQLDLQCIKCDWGWRSRKENPICCPSCKSRWWKESKEEEKLSCVQCDWEWSPRKENPVCCPQCKSYNWKGESK